MRIRRSLPKLSIGEGTVKRHVTNILAKLEANDRTHAVTIALKRGIIEAGTPSKVGALGCQIRGFYFCCRSFKLIVGYLSATPILDICSRLARRRPPIAAIPRWRSLTLLRCDGTG